MDIIKMLRFQNMVWVFILPLAMMGIDILSGLINALWKEKNFQSSKMRSGLAKKCGEILIIVIGAFLMQAIGLPDKVLQSISAYIVFMELTSIAENLDKLGVPLPKFIKNAINNINHTIQNDEYEQIIDKINKLEKAEGHT